MANFSEFRDELRNNYFWLGKLSSTRSSNVSPSSFASIREAIKPEVGPNSTWHGSQFTVIALMELR